MSNKRQVYESVPGYIARQAELEKSKVTPRFIFLTLLKNEHVKNVVKEFSDFEPEELIEQLSYSDSDQSLNYQKELKTASEIALRMKKFKADEPEVEIFKFLLSYPRRIPKPRVIQEAFGLSGPYEVIDLTPKTPEEKLNEFLDNNEDVRKHLEETYVKKSEFIDDGYRL